MKLKRVSIGLTLGLGIAASQGCMAEPMDESEIGDAEQAVCANYSYAGTFAAVITAMARDMGELHPTKYLVKQSNMWGGGKDGVALNQAAKDKCNSRGFPNCAATQLLLDLQDPGINAPGLVPTSFFSADDYRSNLVSKLQDQVNFENSRTINGQCLPGPHTLTEDFSENGQTWPRTAECGLEYRFTPDFGSGSGSGSGSGGFEVTREAESYNAINRNGSQHNWTQSGGNMNIGPDWGYTWPSPSGAPNLSYNISFPAAGSYKVWVRGMGTNSGNDSAFIGVNNSSNGAVVDLPENGQLGWASASISVPSAGTHSVQIIAREDGLFVDKLVVNQSSSPPSGGGSSGPACNTPADLKLRIQQFSVPNVNFHADGTGIMVDPDPDDDSSGSGSGSGSGTCGNQTLIAYKASMVGACCQTGGKTYKPYRCTNAGCTHLICQK